VDTTEITLPSYFTLAIPLLGTPYFRQCAEGRLLLPNLRLRDLDGLTLAMQPLDPVDEAIEFARALPNLYGYRRKVASHALGFLRRYGGTLSPLQLFAASVNAALIATESAASSPTRFKVNGSQQTYFAPTERLDPLYRPIMPLSSEFERYFRPTMVTRSDGSLSDDVAAT
jgi:hypothetical protein